jgi:hypothetical protein
MIHAQMLRKVNRRLCINRFVGPMSGGTDPEYVGGTNSATFAAIGKNPKRPHALLIPPVTERTVEITISVGET